MAEYWFTIGYFVAAFVLIAVIFSNKARRFIGCVILTALLIWGACALQNAAMAEVEARISYFDLANGEFDVVLPDGNVHAFGLDAEIEGMRKGEALHVGQRLVIVLGEMRLKKGGAAYEQDVHNMLLPCYCWTAE